MKKEKKNGEQQQQQEDQSGKYRNSNQRLRQRHLRLRRRRAHLPPRARVQTRARRRCLLRTSPARSGGQGGDAGAAPVPRRIALSGAGGRDVLQGGQEQEEGGRWAEQRAGRDRDAGGSEPAVGARIR